MQDIKSELGLNFNLLDIHNYEFHTEFRGYSRDQVNEVLDTIIKDYQIMFEEIKRLREFAARSKPTEYVTRYEHELLKRQVDGLKAAIERSHPSYSCDVK